MMRGGLFFGICALFGFIGEVKCHYQNTSTTFVTTSFGTSIETDIGCATTTTRIFYTSTQYTTIFITLGQNSSDHVNTPAARDLVTQTTTVPLATITTTIGTCTIVSTGGVEKVTVTQFVAAQAEQTSTITKYEGTTSIDGCGYFTYNTVTVTGSPIGTTTIYSVLPPPGEKMLRKARDLGPRELIQRDVTYTTETLPLTTVYATPTCTITTAVTLPGQKITLTQLVPYPGQGQTPTPTPTPAVSPESPTPTPANSPGAPTPANTPAVSPGAPTPAVSPPAEIPSPPASVKLGVQPGGTITTTIASVPLTVVELSSGSGAVVNGATFIQGGAATTISGVVVTYASSGLVAVPSSTTTPVGIGGVILSVLGFTELASGSGAVIASQTVTPGGSVTVSGTIYSLPTTGSVPVVVSTQPPAQYTGRASKGGVSFLAELSALGVWMVQILFIM